MQKKVIWDDERRGSAEKSSCSAGQEKKHRHKMFAQKIKIVDDAPNESDEEDNLDTNKASEDKSPADEQRKKKGKSDIYTESNAIQLQVSDKSPEKAIKRKSDE